MPVRDAAPTLVEAVDSILRQTLDDLELIVVDDGSRDGSAEILEGYRSRDPRVRVLTGEAEGVAAALRCGCAEARGRYIARMDADDISLGDRLERQVRVLDASSETAVVGGAYVLLGSDGARGRTVRPPSSDRAIRHALRSYNPIAHATATMRRDAYEAVGGYRLDRAEDYDLWTRLAERFRLENLRSPVLLKREHAAQVSATQLEADVVACLTIGAAARARAEGEPDPLTGAPLSADLLAKLGVDPSAIRDSLLDAYVSRAAALSDVGAAPDAEAMLERAFELDPDRAGRIRAAYTLRACRSAAAAGRPFKAARMGLGGLARRPGAAAAELVRALRR
jgi:hypothetical protein